MLERRGKFCNACVTHFFLLLVFLLWGGMLFAQKNDDQTLWTKKQGLSSNSVNSIVKGRDGFLWIGTFNGLNRYDGETFEVFKHSSDSNSIQSNALTKLLLTREQKLVVGFLSGGISVFDPVENKFKNFKPGHNGLPKGIIEEIYETSSGELWLSVRGHGMLRFNKGKFEHLFDLPDLDISGIDSVRNRIFDVCEIEGVVWFATDVGLCAMPKGQQLPVRIPNEDAKVDYNLQNFVYDSKENKLWMGSWTGGLFSYNLKTKEWNQYTYAKPCEEHCFTNIIMDVKALSENELALATLDRGFAVFNVETKKFQFSPSPYALKNIPKSSRTLFLDENNKDIWMGTDDGLLHKSSLFNPLTPLDALAKNSGESYYDAKHNLTLITTRFADGLHVIDHNEKKTRIIHIPIPEFEDDKTEFIVSLAQRTNGDIFVLSKECLWKLDLSTWKLISISARHFFQIYQKSGNWFAEMVRDSTDNLWIGHEILPGLLKVDLNDSVSVIPIKFPSHFIAEASNQIWVANKKEIATYNRGSQKINTWSVTQVSGFTNETIIQDILSARDTIWIATNFGLFKAKVLEETLTCQPINHEFGLSFETFGNLAQDKSGNLWFEILNMGIGRLAPNGNLNLFPFVDIQGNDLTIPDFYYHKLSTTSMGNKNIVAIGTRSGVLQFNPDSVSVSNELPIFSIRESTIPGRILDSNVGIPNKPPHEIRGNTLNLLFNLVYFKDRTKIRYAYRFKELDAQWKFGDPKNRYITQNDLPYDKRITLEIKVCNEYNVWSQPIHITFQIDSPIWQRGWFIVVTTILLSISVWGIVTFRVGLEKKRADDRLELVSRIHNYEIEAQKEQLELKRKIYSSEIKALRSQMNPHFIFNCLSTIQDQVLGNHSTEATKYIGDFALLLRKILNNSDRPFIKLKEEISMIELYLKMEALRFKDQFTWKIKIDPSVDPDSIEFPPMLVQPIVENAIHHGLLEKEGERNLHVYFFEKQKRLICQVEDNGVGVLKHRKISVKNPERASKGTNLINDRIALLNEAYSLDGLLRIEDLGEITGESGTRVELSFDLAALDT